MNYGEKDFDIFYGRGDLIYELNPYDYTLIFEENVQDNNYFYNNSSQSLEDLHRLFYYDFSRISRCSIEDYSNYKLRFDFAVRTLILSYLYELNRLTILEGRKLNVKHSCHNSFNIVLEKCSPKSKNLKSFIINSKHISNKDTLISIPGNFSQKKYFNSVIQDPSISPILSLARAECGTKCNGKSQRKTSFAVDNLCKKISEQALYVCSEQDKYLALSEISTVYTIIQKSNFFIENQAKALSCFQRYRALSKNKSEKSKFLLNVFDSLYDILSRDETRYREGALFVAGVLESFIEKGLSEVFLEEKPTVIAQKIEKPKKVVLTQAKKVEFIDKFIKKKKSKSKLKKRIVKKKKKIKYTEFFISEKLLTKYGMSQKPLNMEKFKYDFIFTKDLSSILDKALVKYTSHSGLQSLKKHDKLGEKTGAVPLMFLKYLIDTSKHQALYSLQAVIGEEFFVINDIDKNVKKPTYINLKNSSSTNYKWLITILKEPQSQVK